MKVQENLKMGLDIHRTHSSESGDCISIEVRDEESSMRFLKLKISLSDFAECITGLSNCHCIGEVMGLDVIGKTMEMDTMEFEVAKDTAYRNQAAAAYKEALKVAPKGWVPDSGFNSQNSFFDQGGKRMARTTIRRWVSVKKEKQ